MLIQLCIRDFAIVEQLELELAGGMTAVTGETGAGKSILVDAIGLLLGDRADSGVIRHGAGRADLSAVFDLSQLPAASAWLNEHDLAGEGDCHLRRVIAGSGRSRNYINGVPQPAQALRELGELLVDIHGQHEHQSLLRREAQRQLLDDYAGNQSFVAELTERYRNWSQLRQDLRALRQASGERDARLDILRYHLRELVALDLAEGEFFISDKKSLWEGKSLYSLYGEAYTPWEWHAPIFERARKLGMIPFSTPFDASSVEFLETLNVACYKIASFENTDLPLIRAVAATGKPIIISTGMASVAELDETVRAAREAGCKELILLKCTSTYPATPANTNILTIPHLRELFGTEVGLSDHTMGVGVSVASVALGATVVEKHFTLARADGGVDSAFSMEPAEMASLVVETERAWQALGTVSYGATAAEEKSKVFRRSLYIAEDMKAGEVFTPANLRAIRPGFGLPPKFIELVMGKTVKHDVKKGTPLSWELLV